MEHVILSRAGLMWWDVCLFLTQGWIRLDGVETAELAAL